MGMARSARPPWSRSSSAAGVELAWDDLGWRLVLGVPTYASRSHSIAPVLALTAYSRKMCSPSSATESPAP